MPNPFSTLADLLEQLLTDHVDNGLLKQVLENQAIMQSTLGGIKISQDIIQADLLSIKVFLGVPDARIGATPEQLDALGQRMQDETTTVEQFDKAATEPPPS